MSIEPGFTITLTLLLPSPSPVPPKISASSFLNFPISSSAFIALHHHLIIPLNSEDLNSGVLPSAPAINIGVMVLHFNFNSILNPP